MPSILVSVTVAVVAAVASAAVPPNQVAALSDLYSSTSGGGWNNEYNWGFGDPCSPGTAAWYGVSCSNGMMYVPLTRVW
jgi:hypothetical protein